MKIEKDVLSALKKGIFDQREEQWSHVPYEKELILLNRVKHGETNRVYENINSLFPRHNGHLSGNPLKQALYEFIAAVTLVTRFAVEGGVEVETAYSMSDAYIRTADEADSPKAIYGLYAPMIRSFAEKVRIAKKKPQVSWPILKTLEYIDSHLHYNISLNDLGRHIHRNSAYLSVQFKQECGVSISNYILIKRIEEAKLLLSEEKLSISHISLSLGFSSPSYFSMIFKKAVGETPGLYRKHSLREHTGKTENNP
jgi:YesN/AraC family two-component response regulator